VFAQAFALTLDRLEHPFLLGAARGFHLGTELSDVGLVPGHEIAAVSDTAFGLQHHSVDLLLAEVLVAQDDGLLYGDRDARDQLPHLVDRRSTQVDRSDRAVVGDGVGAVHPAVTGVVDRLPIHIPVAVDPDPQVVRPVAVAIPRRGHEHVVVEVHGAAGAAVAGLGGGLFEPHGSSATLTVSGCRSSAETMPTQPMTARTVARSAPRRIDTDITPHLARSRTAACSASRSMRGRSVTSTVVVAR
jgi:hypothetical protein